MLERRAPLVLALDAVLDQEIELQEKYAALLAAERAALARFDSAEVERTCSERESVYDQMQQLHSRRTELMKEFPEFRGRRLSELVQLFCQPEDGRRLQGKILRLKQGIQKTRRGSSEFGQIAQFSLNLVNGVLSMLWSATQHVTRSYTRRGGVKESVHPSGDRHSNVLKEA
ncbi:MAG: flagellar export chaperone FlgN [Oligoflexia bacterium]|nr:flagellar export chaperone FlgN [Oligoflexia bacterium]